MEGIQHRLDCPAKDGTAVETVLSDVVDGYIYNRTRCRQCGRSALVRARTREEPK